MTTHPKLDHLLYVSPRLQDKDSVIRFLVTLEANCILVWRQAFSGANGPTAPPQIVKHYWPADKNRAIRETVIQLETEFEVIAE